MATNQVAHSIKVSQALRLIADGVVDTKLEAAKVAGISNRSLCPDKLMTRPMHGEDVPNLMDLVGNYEGKALSLRQVMIEGATSALQGLASVRDRIGKAEIDRKEAAMIDRCHKWLAISDKLGCFRGSDGSPLSSPSEDDKTRSTTLSVDFWLRSHGHKNGRSATHDKLDALAVSTPTTDPDANPQVEVGFE
jgi:hypothetical protein